VDEASVLELAARLRDLTVAQLEAARVGKWDEALALLEERGTLVQQLQAVDPTRLSAASREAIAGLLEEMQVLDRELVGRVETALQATREAQQAVERNDAAARGYRRALGMAGEGELVDREA
jgi:hypothetical protein